MYVRAAALALTLTLSVTLIAQPLPPELPWNGKSRSLIAPADATWITPAEKSGFRTSPTYAETMTWIRRLTNVAPELRMVSIGRSAEGRDIWMVVASRERVFTPESMRQIGKPTLLVQGGIHAGEIDGKDGGMMLLRDIAFGRQRDLLDRANLLFIPILNVDGHERASRFGRINQRGPEVLGWRTNARNLNLNRDYTKLDSEEIRAVVDAINKWTPELYIDVHVTDGVDYQYDVTFGWNETSGYSRSLTRWLDTHFLAPVNSRLREMGHIPGPLIFALGDDMSKGIAEGNAAPRFSNGYGDVRHLASILVENHSLKPYEQRVLGTRVLLEAALEAVGQSATALRNARGEDESRRNNPVPLDWRAPQNPGTPAPTMEFLGVESRTVPSAISGAPKVEWLGKPVTLRVPLRRESEVALSVPRARAYWIPAGWGELVGRMLQHGIRVERVPLARDVEVTMYHLRDPKLATEAFEGHVRLETKLETEKRTQRFPAGSWRVTTDQPLGDLVTVLLEPASADSFLQWGFLDEILQRTEYVENYVLEPLAEQMLASDPKLAAEFRERLEKDAAFRDSAEQRLRFFYERSPYFDDHWLLYPIAREE